MDGDAVRITVKGRVGPTLSACVGSLDVQDVPRHTVIVTCPGRPLDLVPLLEALDRRGVLVDRITQAS